jgi:hypothetical protein
VTAKQMSEPQVARFVKSMNDQGVGVLRTKKGLLLRLPDGTSTSVHFTNSDVRATSNLYARLRRAGVRHPEDPKNVSHLPDQITQGTSAPATTKKVLKAMEELNYPDSVTVQGMRKVTGLEHITMSKALYHLGFTPVIGKRNSRDWMTPTELLDLRKPDPDAVAAVESLTFSDEEGDEDNEVEAGAIAELRTLVANPVDYPPGVEAYTPEPEQEQTEGTREFIDSHNSWVVDLSKVPVEVWNYLRGLEAAGLASEIRVWRA